MSRQRFIWSALLAIAGMATAIHAGLWEPLVRAPFFVELERRLQAGESRVAVTGLLEGAGGASS